MSFRTAFSGRGRWDGKCRGPIPKQRSVKQQKDWDDYNDSLHEKTMEKLRENFALRAKVEQQKQLLL